MCAQTLTEHRKGVSLCKCSRQLASKNVADAQMIVVLLHAYRSRRGDAQQGTAAQKDESREPFDGWRWSRLEALQRRHGSAPGQREIALAVFTSAETLGTSSRSNYFFSISLLMTIAPCLRDASSTIFSSENDDPSRQRAASITFCAVS